MEIKTFDKNSKAIETVDLEDSEKLLAYIKTQEIKSFSVEEIMRILTISKNYKEIISEFLRRQNYDLSRLSSENFATLLIKSEGYGTISEIIFGNEDICRILTRESLLKIGESHFSYPVKILMNEQLREKLTKEDLLYLCLAQEQAALFVVNNICLAEKIGYENIIELAKNNKFVGIAAMKNKDLVLAMSPQNVIELKEFLKEANPKEIKNPYRFFPYFDFLRPEKIKEVYKNFFEDNLGYEEVKTKKDI